MPSRTLEDKVEELFKTVATLMSQGDNLQKETKDFTTKLSETNKDLAELKTRMAILERQAEEWRQIKEQLGVLTTFQISLALLERAVEELKKTKEEWSRRFWAMAGPILGAVVGVLLGYFLRR
jgi:chromosome segregation ATPase